MRLVRLRVRNIASLRGEHDIHFAEIQKVGQLFAITGETGSGKSTILNTIGLALYGDIYKKNVQQIDVVTLGEKDGSIELLFQVKNKYYLSEWRAKVRKQNGEPYSTPQTPSRMLYEIEGPDFNFPKKASNTNAKELLNLDFDQFCKCIILNQGEFAKFLTSNFTERKNILEKLYPGDMLEAMGRELKQQIDIIESDRKEIEIKLGELKAENLSGEDLKEKRDFFKKKYQELEEVTTKIEILERHFSSLYSYFEKYRENQIKISNLKNEITDQTKEVNESLTREEIAVNNYKSAKNNLETKLPILQELLKKEENLRLLNLAIESLSQRHNKVNKQITDLTPKSESLTKKLSELKLKNEAILEQITREAPLLRSSFEFIDPIFELYNETELLNKEIKGKNETLSSLEAQGINLSERIKISEKELDDIPQSSNEKEPLLQEKKKEIQTRLEIKQRSEIQTQEANLEIQKAQDNLKIIDEQIDDFTKKSLSISSELLPLEATLKLETFFLAKETCLEHALLENSTNCPLCEQSTPKGFWDELKGKIIHHDISKIRQKHDQLTKRLTDYQRETEILFSQKSFEQKIIESKHKVLKEIKIVDLTGLPSLEELEKEIEQTRQNIWKRNSILINTENQKNELKDLRNLYSKQKAETNRISELLAIKTKKLTELAEKIKELLPKVNSDSIRDLKQKYKTFTLLIDSEKGIESTERDLQYFNEQIKNLYLERESIESEMQTKKEDEATVKGELIKNVGNESVSEIIQNLQKAEKESHEIWQRCVDLKRSKEQLLKEIQGRLGQLEELTKDQDLHFSRESHDLREISSKIPVNELQILKDFSLDLSSPKELFLPVIDLIGLHKKGNKESANEARMSYATLSTKYAEWEKVQDKIQVLSIKQRENTEQLGRKNRLFEVLGKDDLRNFVLSLVEENLIHQTNEELKKLCQGRYEIVHQTKSMKMTPEFYILDKFREGARRKVTTLSGGETFMVSLAMALGLAEMTRGQAEIDSLFIDEGFGTLDQESLEDVLDMLHQIQNRGLMVGVISHIKSLTSAISVNLVLKKRNDGTSQISTLYN